MGPKQQVRCQEKDNQNHDINENGDIDEVERLKQKLRESENQRNVLENRLRQNEESFVHERDELLRSHQERLAAVRISHETNSYNRNGRGEHSRYEVPLPRQNRFDGKQSWEGFIHPFESMAESCKWDSNERLFRLKSSLHGEAAEYVFSQLPEDALKSYANLKDAIESRFKERRSLSSYLAELENKKYDKDKETLVEYVAKLKGLIVKSFPSADNCTRETIGVRYFLKGLNDSQAAVSIGMQDPKSLNEARNLLENYNSIRNDVRGPKVRSVALSPTEAYVTETRLQEFSKELKSNIGKKIDILAQKIEGKKQPKESTKEARTRKKLDKKDVKCYACQQKGHYANECTVGKNVPGNQ